MDESCTVYLTSLELFWASHWILKLATFFNWSLGCWFKWSRTFDNFEGPLGGGFENRESVIVAIVGCRLEQTNVLFLFIWFRRCRSYLLLQLQYRIVIDHDGGKSRSAPSSQEHSWKSVSRICSSENSALAHAQLVWNQHLQSWPSTKLTKSWTMIMNF